jgi:hypothetical protein
MGLLSRLLSIKAKAPGAKVVSHKVAGTSLRQKEIQAMGRKNPDYGLDKRGLLKRWPQGVTVYEYTFSPKKAELVPEPENPHDPKAIKVLVDGVHVGYIKAGSCAHIHKLLSENRIQSIKPSIIGGKYKNLYALGYDGDKVVDYEFEKDETTIGVRLEIAELPPVSR